MASRESSLLFTFERGLLIAHQARQEKKALCSRGRGHLSGFFELRHPWGFSPEASKIRPTGLKSSIGRTILSLEIRKEPVPCLFPLLVLLVFLGMWLHHSKLCLHSHVAFPSSAVMASLFVSLYHNTCFALFLLNYSQDRKSVV